MRRLWLAAIVAYAITGVPLSAQPDRKDVLLARASAYVQEFIARFANVVAEERYVQEVNVNVTRLTVRGLPASERLKRELRSDFLLVAAQESPGLVVPFRDVFEVDGKPVRERDDRLTKLLVQPANESLAERVRQITEEGNRYNLVGMGPLTSPLTAVGFLQPMYRDRFRFLVGTNDKKVGPTVWTLQFNEFRTPTILRNGNGDLHARGNLWVEEDTGRIVKSDLQIGGGGINTIRITTTFGFDERLGVSVPIEMRESYPYHGGTNTVATYSRFRRFDVTTEETTGKPRSSFFPTNKTLPSETDPPVFALQIRVSEWGLSDHGLY